MPLRMSKLGRMRIAQFITFCYQIMPWWSVTAMLRVVS